MQKQIVFAANVSSGKTRRLKLSDKSIVYLFESRRLNHVRKVGHDPGRHVDLRQHVHLEVGRERVGQTHVAREGAENEVAHLDTVGWNDITERVVEITEKFREVVQKHQQHAQSSFVQQLRRFGQLRVPQERRQELEEIYQQLRVHSPSLKAVHKSTFSTVHENPMLCLQPEN